MNDDLEPLPPDLKALLADERAHPREGAASASRILDRLERSVAAVAIGAAGASSAGVGASSSAAQAKGLFARWFASKGGAIVSALAVGTATGGAVGYRVGTGKAEAPQVGSRPVVSERAKDEPAAPRGSSGPVTTPEVVPSSFDRADRADRVLRAGPATSDTPARKPVARDADLRGELALVQMGRTALGRREYEGALDALDEHAKKFPRGVLAEEREGLAVQALVGAARYEDARRRGGRFREKYPQSALLPGVLEALRSIP